MTGVWWLCGLTIVAAVELDAAADERGPLDGIGESEEAGGRLYQVGKNHLRRFGGSLLEQGAESNHVHDGDRDDDRDDGHDYDRYDRGRSEDEGEPVGRSDDRRDVAYRDSNTDPDDRYDRSRDDARREGRDEPESAPDDRDRDANVPDDDRDERGRDGDRRYSSDRSDDDRDERGRDRDRRYSSDDDRDERVRRQGMVSHEERDNNGEDDRATRDREEDDSGRSEHEHHRGTQVVEEKRSDGDGEKQRLDSSSEKQLITKKQAEAKTPQQKDESLFFSALEKVDEDPNSPLHEAEVEADSQTFTPAPSPSSWANTQYDVMEAIKEEEKNKDAFKVSKAAKHEKNPWYGFPISSHRK